MKKDFEFIRGGKNGAVCRYCGKEFDKYDESYVQHEIDCAFSTKSRVVSWEALELLKKFQNN